MNRFEATIRRGDRAIAVVRIVGRTVTLAYLLASAATGNLVGIAIGLGVGGFDLAVSSISDRRRAESRAYLEESRRRTEAIRASLPPAEREWFDAARLDAIEEIEREIEGPVARWRRRRREGRS